MGKLFAACTALLLMAAGQAVRGGDALPLGAEFPPQDQLLWSLQRGGLAKTLAVRRFAEAPDSSATVRLLADANDQSRLLRALRLIVDSRPERIGDAFEALRDATWRFRGDDEETLRNGEALRGIVTDARKRLPDLHREVAARAERVFVNLDAELSRNRGDGSDWPARLARFAEQHRGTEAALLAAVDVIGYGRVSRQQFEALDAFIQAHPGTVAAAKALYLKGFQLHTINTIGILEPRGADPTDRFMRVLAIVKELDSGRYPACEWVDKAPSLVTGFFMPPDSPISAENIEKLLNSHLEFVRTHFVLDGPDPASNGVGYVLTRKMAELFKRRGDGIAGFERMLADLERGALDPVAVRYLQALAYMQQIQPQPSAERELLLGKTRTTLSALTAEGHDLYHRKALATLASLEFAEAAYGSARDRFRKYADAYPQSNWTWVAMMRIGQCEDALGNPQAAAAAFLDAAKKYDDLPLARVLGHEYAARSYEAAGNFDRALIEHRIALDRWDNAFGQRYTTYVKGSPTPDGPFPFRHDTAEVTKVELARRIAQLEKSLSARGGALLERGRWLLAKGRQSEALAALARMLTHNLTGPAAADAQYLMHRARLERALALADVERPDADVPAAVKELDAIARQPVDFAVTAAKIARASLLWKHGASTDAEALMAEALNTSLAHQLFPKLAGGVERDVADIRSAVFLPTGGDLYSGGRWNAFSFPSTPPPFSVINPDILVKFHDGDITQVTVLHTLPDAGRIVFVDTEQIALLKTILVRLGGTKRRQPQHVMETPNQPVGDSMRILELWNKYFPGRPGHWGGWDLETYPVITEIHFSNVERTRAAARVTIGYSGGTVELEKEAGKWIAKRLTSRWIT